MRNAVVTPGGDRIRWAELPGQEPPRVYVHGLGATSPAYFADYLLPEADGPLPGADALTAAGVAVVAIPDCGHNIMLDNPEAFAQATAAACADREARPDRHAE
ncbi:hypothetical protein YWIDRAFT_01137 [Streptomyces sp. SceaMP-e96]|uniref:hypothetical protein n=1 Tax=unclassified Streptomyces TaxID=2593676 RepID=UPI000823BE9A|nr:hypothetical protein [Streptomyces sp. SceaMP-e96]MYT11912.1 hypothetical protein [Streptomyces sp. SID4951]SCK12966.1 hypothetical protein YWIDRAFT_01137 [Streptomyces sp. SceaMP-e96]